MHLRAVPDLLRLRQAQNLCFFVPSMNEALASIPKQLRLPLALWAVFLVLLISDQFPWWGQMEEYSFGYLVPLFVAYILYDRWPRLQRIWGGPTVEMPAREKKWTEKLAKWEYGVPGWFLGGSMFVAVLAIITALTFVLLGAAFRSSEGQNLISSNLFAFAFAGFTWGMLFLWSDRRLDGERIPWRQRLEVVSVFLFPSLIWVLSVPMVGAVYDRISLSLQGNVAQSVFWLFDSLGYAIVRQGSVLQLPTGQVGVEDACSGIRSLMACLFAGSFLGSAFFFQTWKKVFLVATAMGFAFVNNIFRSLFLTAWAYGYGPEALSDSVMVLGMDLGNVHDFTGNAVLVLTVIGLLVLVKIFSFEWETELPEEDPPASPDQAPATV